MTRKPTAPGEEKVSTSIAWSANLDRKIRAMANQQKLAVTELVRKYVTDGLARDSAPPVPATCTARILEWKCQVKGEHRVCAANIPGFGVARWTDTDLFSNDGIMGALLRFQKEQHSGFCSKGVGPVLECHICSCLKHVKRRPCSECETPRERKVGLGLTGLLRWRESGLWLVGHRDIFILAQAPTLQEAIDRWCMTLAHEVLWRYHDGETMSDVPKTPPDVRDQWIKKHEAHNAEPEPEPPT